MLEMEGWIALDGRGGMCGLGSGDPDRPAATPPWMVLGGDPTDYRNSSMSASSAAAPGDSFS
jgi:hypothetical protein